jgi:hypothetical protein
LQQPVNQEEYHRDAGDAHKHRDLDVSACRQISLRVQQLCPIILGAAAYSGKSRWMPNAGKTPVQGLECA